jgi:hypothetical protein
MTMTSTFPVQQQVINKSTGEILTIINHNINSLFCLLINNNGESKILPVTDLKVLSSSDEA